MPSNILIINFQHSFSRIPENYVQCPSCDRWFGPKAADRHIEWCTSKLFRMPSGNGPSAHEKKRWEDRVNVSQLSYTQLWNTSDTNGVIVCLFFIFSIKLRYQGKAGSRLKANTATET
jgi:hypothetical protein